jgi:hypothetical protein
LIDCLLSVGALKKGVQTPMAAMGPLTSFLKQVIWQDNSGDKAGCSRKTGVLTNRIRDYGFKHQKEEV